MVLLVNLDSCILMYIFKPNNFSTVSDQKSLEEDAERKIGWVLKLFFAGTATFIGYNLFPYMGMSIEENSQFKCIKIQNSNVYNFGLLQEKM